MAEVLTFLHLSDIHFRSAHSNSVHDLDEDLRREVERDALDLRREFGPPTGILVTGDIAFAGIAEEFRMAAEWLRSLCGMLDCPEQNIWTVPGNHDVDRQRIKEGKTLRSFRQEIRATPVEKIDDCMREWLGDRTTGPQLFSPVKDYMDFAAPFQCDVSVERLFWHKDLLLNDGSTLRLVGLNSVLPSDESDDDGSHRLVVGSAQYRLEREEGVEYLVMCHHPPQWLRDIDAFNDQVNSRSHVQLYGHKHKQRLEKVNESLRLFAGALHPDRRERDWEPRYNYLTCAVEGTESDRSLRVEVRSRVWSETDTKFLPDRDQLGNPVREYRFALRAWTPPQASAVSSSGASERLSPVVVASSPTEAEPRRQPMDVIRRLAYRFLTLPYTKKLRIAMSLDLVADDDQGVDESELYRRFFLRARAQNKLAALWDAVEAEYPGGDAMPNPLEETSRKEP